MLTSATSLSDSNSSQCSTVDFDSFPSARLFNLMLEYKNLWKSYEPQDLDGIYLIPDFKDPFKFHGACFIRSGGLTGHAVEYTLIVDHDNNANVTWKDDQFNSLEQSKTLLNALKSVKTFLNTQTTATATYISTERSHLFSELRKHAVTKNRK